MESRKCRSKNCPKILPIGYKYKYCEECRSKQVKGVKGALGLLATAGAMVGSTIVYLATKGKINLKK